VPPDPFNHCDAGRVGLSPACGARAVALTHSSMRRLTINSHMENLDAEAAEAGVGEDPAGYGRPWAGSLSANLCLCVELFGERGSHSRISKAPTNAVPTIFVAPASSAIILNAFHAVPLVSFV
jgi:hypothetical protein